MATAKRYIYRPLTTGPQFNAQLNETLRDIGASVDAALRGIGGYTSVPTAGTWAVGDFVRNQSPVEAGTTPNKYVVIGWSCVASGSPGTWLECRCLTGN